jgi:hypothetical protein
MDKHAESEGKMRDQRARALELMDALDLNGLEEEEFKAKVQKYKSAHRWFMLRRQRTVELAHIYVGFGVKELPEDVCAKLEEKLEIVFREARDNMIRSTFE